MFATSVWIYPCHPIISGFQYCWRAVVPRPVCPRSAEQIQLDSDRELHCKSLNLCSCFGWWRSWSRSSLQLWIHLSRGTIRASAATKKADAVNLCIRNSPHRVNSLHMVLRVWQSTHSNFGNSVTLSSQPRFQMVPAKPKALPLRHTATLRHWMQDASIYWGPNQSGHLYVTDRDWWNWVPWAPAAFHIQIV